MQGSIEYIYAELTTDRVLNDQLVSIAITASSSPQSWMGAQWVGDAGKYRAARVLLDGTLAKGRYNVFARITDHPEAPIIKVGRLKIV